MYFGIYNSHTIMNWKQKGKQTIIIGCLSKSEYNTPNLKIPTDNNSTKVLLLDIKDSDYLSIENAKQLNDFIINNEFDEVITFCALGISRSPAIMICISKIIKSPIIKKIIKENYIHYNKHIVNDFEQFQYQTKIINTQNFIIETKSNQKHNKKEKQKTKSISLKY